MNANDSTIAVVEHSDAGSGNELFSIDPGIAIWTWVVFGLLFIVLRKFAWSPLMESVRERELVITNAVKNAEKVEKKLADVAEKQREMLTEAEEQARLIVNNGRKAAEDVARDIALKARADSESALELARKQMNIEKNRALEEIRKETVDLVLRASEKFIESSINNEEHRRIVERSLEQL